MKSILKRSITILSFSIVILLMMYCGNSSEQNHIQQEAGNQYLNHSDTAKYVGMDQCKLCHQDIYNSYMETGMGKSFEHASKQKSSANFDKHSTIYDKYSNFYYKPFWEGDSMKIMEFRLKGKDTIYKRIERVDYIIGSGQHTNSHIYETNGYLHQMPMTYYTQKGEWNLPPGFESGFNTRFSRKIGLECMSCHNSYPELEAGSENKFKALPEGINCERCHGPGSIHVQQRSTGTEIDTSKFIDYSIVNPGKLPIDRQFDVCQRCHLQGNTVLKEGKSFYDFKPGMKLSDFMTVFLPRYKDADDQFIMASHADRLKQSECFIKSLEATTDTASLRPYKNALTCVTCHNPHVSVKVTGKEVFNNACKNCHSSNTQNGLCTEKQEVRNLKQDNCVSCHMPRSGSIDIPHVTVHDHFIRKPIKAGPGTNNKKDANEKFQSGHSEKQNYGKISKEEAEKVKAFIGLYSVNEKDPVKEIKAKAYIQQFDKFDYNPVFLDSAEYYLSNKTKEDILNNFETLIHLYFIKHDHVKILEYVNMIGKDVILKNMLVKKSWSNDHAWCSYRIGEAYYNKGDVANAYVFYKHADELAPFNPEFKNKIGTVLMAQNKVPEAIVVFEATLKENPKFVQVINNLGYANLIIGNSVKANQLYQQALAFDPDYEPLLMNLAGYNVYQKNFAEAREILKRILEKDPKNEQAKKVLEQISNL